MTSSSDSNLDSPPPSSSSFLHHQDQSLTSSPTTTPSNHHPYQQTSNTSIKLRDHHQRFDSSNAASSNQHPSKTVLTIALAKAQSAVLLDTALQIPEAIEAYTQAVLLLEEVIEKIEEIGLEREQKELESLLRDQAKDKIWSEEIWNKLNDEKNVERRLEIEEKLKDRELKWHEKRLRMEKRKKARSEEEDRLIGIHNTYASRIRELEAELVHVGNHQMIHQIETDSSHNLPAESPTHNNLPKSFLDDYSPESKPSPLPKSPLRINSQKRTSSSPNLLTPILNLSNHNTIPNTIEEDSIINFRRSFGSDKTAREEEKDKLGTMKSSNRDRSSSSVSGGSGLGKQNKSNESLATSTRTSISSSIKPSNHSHIDDELKSPVRPSNRLNKRSESIEPINLSNNHKNINNTTILVSSSSSSSSSNDHKKVSVKPLELDPRLINKSTDSSANSPGLVSIIKSHPSPPLPTPHIVNRRPSNASMIIPTQVPISIPMRMRAYSQPGKRVPSNSNPPALPSTLRKTSVPITNPSQFKPSTYAHAHSNATLNLNTNQQMKINEQMKSITPIRKPFHLMKLIRNTISNGGYLTNKLYIPKQLWTQTGIRIQNLETKIKLIEILEASLEIFLKDLKEVNLFSKIENFEISLKTIEVSLGKKLGLGFKGDSNRSFQTDLNNNGKLFQNNNPVGVVVGGKHKNHHNTHNLNGFVNRLGKGIDRITIGRNASDLFIVYVESISRLFNKSQLIDDHLINLSNNNKSLEIKFKKISEFYSIIICRFVVTDLGLLLDKYVKRGGNWCSD
ncbi:hypothetical protein CROQUDRAFT_174213 [Cronartium quercuum f. sp. fusiforme G11]|uniref:MIT domain-containing protein n=1 Tax=Cronartium quercuum f. sp. fusiforme G11 TaxID=708437 RepID=A0A9P6T9F6_9BASI|nr:hypothetical protein CROQUDRAFT_174213 [Cronartium quercuum f. sp. fusiforme G11]